MSLSHDLGQPQVNFAPKNTFLKKKNSESSGFDEECNK